MGVIDIHHTPVDTTSPWDGAAEVSKLKVPITASVANGMFAYYESRGAPDDNGDGYPDTKGAYKFPHHHVTDGGIPGDANLRGVNSALAYLSSADIPESNVAGIKAHLRAHQEDAKSPSLARFISIVSEFVEKLSRAAGIKRDVSLEDIWMFVQEQLDAQSIAGTTPRPENGDLAPDDMYEWDFRSDYVLDVRTDGKGISVIITKSDGKLYKAPVTVAADNSITVGDYTEVAIEFMPVTAAREITVKRQADGRYRWFAMPACTAVLNRSGEIDSSKLFADFENHIERTGEYPEMDFFHLGESLVLGKADWVSAEKFAYCASGLFDDTPIGRAAAKSLEANPGYWGLSIAYVPTQEPEIIRAADGESVAVYNAGINRFISLLPESTAASILTNISTEGVNRMNKTKKDALKMLVGDDQALADELEQRIDGVNRTVEQNNMIRREGETTTKETHVIETVSPAPAAPVAQEARALTPDDMMVILDSPEFENKVIEIIKKLQAAESAAPVEPAEMMEDAQKQVNTELRSALENLTRQVSDLAKGPQEIAREILDDMPEKLKYKPSAIIRPRNVPAPADLKKKTSLAEVAASGMDKIRQQKATAQN